MIKRLSKSRRSAILEHLLDLEKQIRSELDKDKPEENATRSSTAEPVRRRSSALPGGADEAARLEGVQAVRADADTLPAETHIITNEFTARSVH